MNEIFIRKIKQESARALAEDVLRICGVSATNAKEVVNSFMYADLRGYTTHGIGRLPLYVKKIDTGNLTPSAQPSVIRQHGATALIDACNGFGQLTADAAVKLGEELADKYGIGLIGARNSNSFGAAGYWGSKAAKMGYAVIICTNAPPAVAPPGGIHPIFGTNPLCLAFPGTKTHSPLVLDMATTVAARGKIRAALKNGERIPEGWAVNKKGEPTTDPQEAIEGWLCPIGGYKGFGLAMFIDIFAGLMTGSAFAGQVGLLSDQETKSGTGHLFCVMKPQVFMDEAALETRINEMYDELNQCGEDIRLPGQRGDRKAADCSYIELSANQCQEILDIARMVGSREKFEYEETSGNCPWGNGSS